MIYGIIGILLIGGLVFYLVSCNNKPKASRQGNSQQVKDKPKETKVKGNHYSALRKQSFSTPEQLQLELDDTKSIIVFGLIMEWHITEAVISVVAFKTGDASIYFSTGQIFLGGVAMKHQECGIVICK